MTIQAPQTARARQLSIPSWLIWTLAVLFALGIGWLALKFPVIAIAVGITCAACSFFLWKPDMAGVAFLFILYWNLVAVGVQFHGMPRTVGMLLPLILAIPILNDLMRGKRIVVSPMFPILLVYFLIGLVSLTFSKDPGASWLSLQDLLYEGVLLFFLVTNVIRNRVDLRRAVWALLAAGVLMTAVPLHQQLTRNFNSNYRGFAQVGGEFSSGVVEDGKELRQLRLSGTVGEKNRFSQVMLMLVPLGLFRFWGERSRRMRILALFATAAVMTGFALAFSRGGALALMMLLVLMGLMRIISMPRMVAIFLALAIVPLALPQYQKRLASLKNIPLVVTGATAANKPDGSIKGRATEMLAAALVFADYPLMGVGPGMFRSYAQEYGNQLGIRRLTKERRAHSLLLEIAAETGAPGLLTFLVILTLTVHELNQIRIRLARSDPELAGLAASFLLAIAVYFTTGLFLHMSYLRYFFVILALSWCVIHIGREVRSRLDAPQPPARALA